MRPLASMPPPAANGMTSVMGWVGQSCAKDALASAITAAEAVNVVLRMLLSWQVWCRPKGPGARPVMAVTVAPIGAWIKRLGVTGGGRGLSAGAGTGRVRGLSYRRARTQVSS